MIYVTDFERIEESGMTHALEWMPHRQAGGCPYTWLDRVRDFAAANVKDGYWSEEQRRDLVFVAELMVAEMRRYPEIVDWSMDTYTTAVSGRVDVCDMCELVGEGYISKEDRFIDEFIDSMIAGAA